jgi:GT2 family glycosyltransferase
MFNHPMHSAAAGRRPQVSFIVASYNHQRFIGKTLQSILEQTVPDFEAIVVDDLSTDASRDVVRSFDDPRIHLHVNDRNLGLALTYNRGIGLARGQYLNFVDSDDWIEPRKIEEQLGYLRHHPEVDIAGTYVNFVDIDGNRHPRADDWEKTFNRPYDFNAIETWLGCNKLTTCSAMIARAAHERVGLRDASMAVGTDFELWTRAYAQGCRFGLLQTRLLNYRLHDDSVSRRDVLTTYLEISYLLQKNILPVIEARSALHLIPAMIDWHLDQAEFRLLTEEQRCRLLALLITGPKSSNCLAYKETCLNGEDPALLAVGRRLYAGYYVRPVQLLLRAECDALRADSAARFEQIQTLTQLLQESEADSAARFEQIQTLTQLLQESEADRAARFEQIQTLTRGLRESEAERVTRCEQIHALTRVLEASEAERVAGCEQIQALTRAQGGLPPGSPPGRIQTLLQTLRERRKRSVAAGAPDRDLPLR